MVSASPSVVSRPNILKDVRTYSCHKIGRGFSWVLVEKIINMCYNEVVQIEMVVTI